MRLTAAVLSCALCVTGAVGGAWASRPQDPDYAAMLDSASDIYAVTDEEGEPTRYYVASGASKTVQRLPKSATRLPWSIDITYSLNGPNVSASTVANASGLVGVHVTVRPAHASGNTARQTIPMVAFTVPSQVADDISADSNVSVSTQGTNTLIAAAGQAGTTLEFSCYMNAKHFTMSSIALAVLPGNDTGNGTNASSDAAQLTDTAFTLVDSLTDAGSSEHQQLIDQLKALRANEQQLAQSVTAERTVAHKQTFQNYMAAYVGSYTTHLSGSIGTSTQLPALVGTAGELSGDTPLAQAVLDLANAVNNVSAAHMHDGAVDALDEVIRRIQQQGTTGLVDDLTKEAAEEATKGSKQYAAGQKQLSAAMIPYSMKYTDVYTAKLSALIGGSSANASAYAQQAISETNNSDELKDSQSKVDAAMAALATACEHTGKSQALKQILLRFSNQFEVSGTNTTAAHDSTISDARLLTQGLADPQSSSFYGKTKAAEAKRKAAIARKKAQAAQQQQSQDSNASLVDDTMSMSASDVMSYANGLTSALGGGKSDSSAGSGSEESENSAGANATNDAAAKTATGKDEADEAPILFGFSQNGTGTLLTHDFSTLIAETVEIGDAGQLIAQAATQLGSAAVLQQSSTQTPAYLLVIPTV
ncbi:hypothetical protein BISA_0429 [Bifidobacterium saguini DSM 23967]|uniref:Tubuliform spidroin n=2 Tax=Bifidobacterium saguini TaxID=762210 RepID=A0A087DB37_9BIFI|nr:hypothetical protein [Bifidobacterium saguini]KFI92737.1 hypothetical protein BISA_0429 [Bifidobacterium saguini DSM 23967]QTB91743.1 hypothetical protein BSD967_04885 [Bifidobacterium saguini]